MKRASASAAYQWSQMMLAVLVPSECQIGKEEWISYVDFHALGEYYIDNEPCATKSQQVGNHFHVAQLPVDFI